MTTKTKLFFLLWLSGLSGVFSLLLVDFTTLASKLPVPQAKDMPEFTFGMLALSLLQPAALLALAVVCGVRLASKVGLSSPCAEAIVSRNNWRTALKPQILPGIAGGIIGGLAIVATTLVSYTFLSKEVLDKTMGVGSLLPLSTRLLYGGIVEELLLRWGFMTLLVWLAWRFLQKREGVPKPMYVIGAIVVSSVLFAIGHLPLANLIVPDAPLSFFVVRVILANSLFGLIAGYLYWKKGLESAILAHLVTHLVLHMAIITGLTPS